MNESVVKHGRKIAIKVVRRIFANMSMWDRIVFVFTGKIDRAVEKSKRGDL